MRVTICLIAFFGISLFACQNKEAAVLETQTTDFSNGRRLFGMHCAGCHNFKRKSMGPALGGLAGKVSPEWMKSFISDPKAMIDKGDERAMHQFEVFHTYMPAYGHLPTDSLDAIIAFILSRPAPDPVDLPEGALADPIPEVIAMSELVVGLKPKAKFPFTNEISPWTRIVKMDFIPGTQRHFVGDLQGRLYFLAENGPESYLDLAEHFPYFVNEPGLATGFGSYAFHPDFINNGLLYTTHSEMGSPQKADFAFADSIPVKLQWVLTEWQMDNTDTKFVPIKHRELLRVDFVTQIHGMQDIEFNPLAQPGDSDYGLLYVGVGDGGSVERSYPFLAIDEDKVWGCVWRIDPLGKNSRNKKYGIPADNPFQKAGQAGEVYARGFRNPHRIHWLQDGRLLVTNIGHFNIESLYHVLTGDHCGWPFREGKFRVDPYTDLSYVFALKEGDDVIKYNYPVAQFDHDEGNAISGGYEYLGSKIPEFQGKYLFGTIVRGRLFYLNTSELKRGQDAIIHEWQVKSEGQIKTLFETTKASRVDLRFGRDASGEVYIMTKPDGMLYGLEK